MLKLIETNIFIFKENLKLIINCCLDKIHAEITTTEYINFFLYRDAKEMTYGEIKEVDEEEDSDSLSNELLSDVC